MGLSRRTGSLGWERTLAPAQSQAGAKPASNAPCPTPQGLNGQKKYQIHLKSVSGPIEVLLVNKEAWSSPPVAVPVPPPEDLLQSPPAVSTPPTPPKPAMALTQDVSRPSSPQMTAPTCVPGSTEAQGVTSPSAEITGKARWASGDGWSDLWGPRGNTSVLWNAILRVARDPMGVVPFMASNWPSLAMAGEPFLTGKL